MKLQNPLLFLASLGAGGIAIIPFAFLQYVHPHGTGLITLGEIVRDPVWPTWVYLALIAIMLVFSTLHLILSVRLFSQLPRFLQSEAYPTLLQNPLAHTGLLAPFISIVMTLNVFVGPIRFFVPVLYENLQLFMLPALIVWLIIGFFLLKTQLNLLAIAFAKGFDAAKIHFGWLLHSFALGMFTVTGMGIAALAHSQAVADTAAFISLITGSAGLFLFVVKIVTVFQSHFAAAELPEKQFMPGFLIALPNITLYAISFFRFGHYLEHQHGATLDAYYLVVITTAFAFATWYLLFGLVLLKNFIRTEYFGNAYYVQLWGLVCPFVAYAVLGSFAYYAFVPSAGFIVLIVLSSLVAIYLFFDLLRRALRCSKNDASMECL